MKSFIKWANSRTPLETTGWVLWAISMAVIACLLDPPLAFVGYLLLLTCMIISVRHYKGVLTVLLIALLLLPTANQSRSQQQKQVVECNLVIIGGVVIIVGGIVIYKMVKFCQQHLAPQPPPSTPGTNAPPETNNTSFANGFALNPVTTPIGSDISKNGWMDNTVPTNPVPFQHFVTFTIHGSTNLTDWTNAFTANLWLSSNSIETVILDGNGAPVSTNWCPGNPYTGAVTNRVLFPLYKPNTPHQFFRAY